VNQSDSPNPITPDEIPIARRSSNQSRARSKDRVSIIFVFILFLTTVFFLVSPLTTNKGIETSLNEAAVQTDGRLLGHYPYPEANIDNLVEVYPGLKVHKDTYKAYVQLSNAAYQDGVRLVLLSGFRSIALQKDIFYGMKSSRNQIAIERARVSAPPGYSEHSTGYAIDIGDATRRETDLEESFETTRAFKWLKANSAKYHFVLSFPKSNLQGVSYEPWHWRYEGTVDALKKFQSANEIRRSNKL
tara:strand:- start:425 stop:1159 length:735 start_codon:yes stop_codon:yes gene_type:complete